MDRLRITGNIPLHGTIPIAGAKNAALPLMCASLLSKDALTLSNMPELADITTMRKLLAQHGVSIEHPRAGEWKLSGSRIDNFTAPYEMVRTMRASVLVLGPLLARFGEAKVSLPGGCAIGTRPIDLHLRALEEMGAEIDLADGYVNARAPKGLKGAEIQFDKVTVTGTENILMAAALADGESVIGNAAREPEVTDLAQCLIKMGAMIEGVGSDTLKVKGVATLKGCEHRVIADRIETGTYAAAVAITGGDVVLAGANLEHLHAVAEKFHEAGVSMTQTEKGVRVKRMNGALEGIDVMTQPYPGFPTDMQAQFMAMLAVADGASMVTETIFENRFMHVPELVRMGARINVHGASAMIRGVKQLTGAEVMATDLRASSSLVIAALAAKGDTVINRVYHLDRGYERLEEKLRACGAKVERLKEAVAA